MEAAPRFVGIDASEARLDVAPRPDGDGCSYPNDPEGIAAPVDRLEASPTALILLEATGGPERGVALAAAGLPARVVDPARVRQFARSTGQHPKTDALDARALAHYAGAARPEARDLPDEESRQLRALPDRRRELVAMRVGGQDRLRRGPTAAVRADLEAHVAYLAGRIDRLDAAASEAIRAEEEWRPRDEVLRSVPGVGPQTSRTLPGALPELGTLTGKRMASLVGLAPRARDSGTVRGARTIFGGRAEVRTALYMASLSATRSSPELRTFYRRLRRAGKAAKVALTAVSRELLTIVNAMIRDMKHWEPNKTTAAE